MIAVRDREAPGDSKLDVPVRIQYAVALNRIVSIEQAQNLRAGDRGFCFTARTSTKLGGLDRLRAPQQ